MPAVARETVVHAGRTAVTAYLRDVPSLAAWTTFFLSVAPERDGRHDVESILGPIQTWIEEETAAAGTRVTICSEIRGTIERATLDVSGPDGAIVVRFTVTLPDHLGADAVAEQHAEMGLELAQLKALLEQPAAGRGFLFPGQGSQCVGMGADLVLRSRPFVRLLRRAEELTARDIASAMLAGPAERLNDTVATQVSVFALSVAVARMLDRQGIRPSVVAGHSVGEYAALVAGGWLDAEDALVAVVARAEAMAACCAAVPGAMTAVIGLTPAALDRIREETGSAAVVANRNSPRQSVVAGEREAVDALSAAALERGATLAIPLTVAGAFHSPLMGAAEAAFAPVVEALPLRRGDVPLVSSVTGALVGDVESYRAQLARQITAPVRWDRAMATLRRWRGGGFLEVGPGKTLRSLLRHSDRDLRAAGCDSVAACRRLAV